MVRLNDEIKRILKHLVLIFAISNLIYLVLYAYVWRISNTDKIVMLNTDSDDYRFEYVISKVWGEHSHGYVYGMQCDIEVENHTRDSLLDWKIVLNLHKGSHIDSSWNGNFELDENKLTITSLDYNETVEASEIQPIGMVIYGSIDDCIESGYITFHQNKKVVELPVFWMVFISTSIAYIAEITGIYYSIKNETLKKKQRESLRIINQSFITFANTIDAKDSYTKGHSQRVAIYSRELSRRMGFDEEFQQNIFYVGLLHDIGKIGVQDAILKKTVKLTYDEFNEIKEHVSMGGDILKPFTAIRGIADGARYHHERYDGTGYMEGLKGEDIPILARIISVADAFDAMSSARCYRAAMDIDKIIKELNDFSGKQFDPKIVPHMIDMINEGIAPVVLEDNQLEKELEF